MTLWRIHIGTRGRTLATHARRADGFAARLVGLMGRRALAPGEALVLVPAAAVHSFFLRFPLDLLYLDRDGTILRAQEALPPWRLGALRTVGCRAILELPAGSVAASGSRVGDRLRIERIEG